MKKTILLSLLSSGLLISQAANAGEWAIGGLIGQSDADICSEFSGFSCDDSDTSLGINLSYDFSKAWGLELGYMELGDYNLAGFDIDTTALYLAGTGTVDFNDYWSLTGRLGISELDASVSGLPLSDSSTGGFAGVSLNYNFNDNLQAQFRYDNFDGDIDALALGLKYSL